MKINTARVKELMKNKGLTPADLAKLMGVHRQAVYDMFAGKTGKTFRLINRLSKAFHISEKDLLE
jgi:plasmid maintenance system antidote protein VapI